MTNISEWRVEYFEKQGGAQPAEEFEDFLDASANRDERRIGGKLIRVVRLVSEKGSRAGGGYVEKCHGQDYWQMKADSGNRRGREFFGFDGDRAVLLSGVVKGPREATPPQAYQEAERCWREYLRYKKVSPEKP